ncbi:MAG: pitrilysin family protein [Acidobacteriota bacterium]
MTTTRMRVLAAALAALGLVLGAGTAIAATGEKIPPRPEQLRYPKLAFDVPEADGFRHVLSNGVVVYVAEDHDLPLVNVSVRVKVGSFLDPEGKTGLASITGRMLRQGGAGDLDAAAFDERADFLAAQISSYTGDTGGGAGLNCITPVLDEALDLFFSMLVSPRFDADRIEVEKTNRLEAMKQRNDDAGDILAREWQWLMRGREHFTSRYPTKADLDAITREDMIAFHRRWWNPRNMLITVSGDVDTKAILAQLERRLAAFGDRGESTPWPPPKPEFTPVPGLYHVEKDIPQAKVNIGHLTFEWTDWDAKDPYALRVMSHILGDSGFTSRITKRIRSDEGLAYSAWARFGIGTWWPGIFRVSYQSKSSTVALAAKLAFEEIRRIQAEPVSPDELDTARNSIIDSFPQRFNSPASTLSIFAEDEWIGRPHEYWTRYRDRIAAVGREDVQRVARQYLHPDRTVFLVVGRWDEIAPGDPDGRASMAEFGEPTHLPLRDPLTLEPIEPAD